MTLRRNELRRGAGVLAAMLAALLVCSCDLEDPLRGNGEALGDADAVPIAADPGTVAGSLVISEVVAQNTLFVDGSGAAPLGFVEIQSLATETLRLGGVVLTFIPVDAGSGGFSIPLGQGFEIAPNEFVVISLGGVDAGDADPNDLIASTDPPDATNALTQFQILIEGAEPLDQVTVPTADIADDVSFSRVTTPEGVFFVEVTSPTPGAPNAAPANPIPLEFRRGDVNEDGVVDMQDLADLEPFVTDEPTLPNCEDALDVNDDGRINVVDVVFLAKFLAGEPGFDVPPPFTNPSTDPTTDSLTCNTIATVPATGGGTK